jgi:outer membrane lipoprotein-sorting protein
MRLIVLTAVSAAVLAAASPQPDPLAEVLARLDSGARTFVSMSARVTWTEYTAVIKETTESAGTLKLKRIQSKVRGLIDYTQPDAKTVALKDKEVWIYLPKINTVQIYQLGKEGDQLYRFLLLGFGTSAAELQKNYGIRLAGADLVGGVKAARLELVPKSGEAKNYLTKIELWIPDGSPHPVQEKLHQKSGDTVLIRYADQQFNAGMADAALEPALPAGVKKEYPGR